MTGWARVAAAADVRDGNIYPAQAADLAIILVRLGDELFAYQAACPHEGTSLAEGEIDLEEGVMICQRHLWEFEIRTGLHLSTISLPDTNLTTWPLRVVDGQVEIDLAAPSKAPA